MFVPVEDQVAVNRTRALTIALRYFLPGSARSARLPLGFAIADESAGIRGARRITANRGDKDNVIRHAACIPDACARARARSRREMR